MSRNLERYLLPLLAGVLLSGTARIAMADELLVFVSAFTAQQLHGGRPPQEGVAGAVDRTHPALADLVLESILAQLSCVADLAPQPVDDV